MKCLRLVVVSAIFINTMNCFSMSVLGQDDIVRDFSFYAKSSTARMRSAIEYLDRDLLIALADDADQDFPVWREWMNLFERELGKNLAGLWKSLSLEQQSMDVVVDAVDSLCPVWLLLLDKIPFQEDADAFRRWGRPFVPEFIVDALDKEKDWRTDQKSMHNYLWTLRTIRSGLRELRLPRAEQVLVTHFLNYCLAEVEDSLQQLPADTLQLSSVPTVRHVELQDLEGGGQGCDEQRLCGGKENVLPDSRIDREVGCLDFFLKFLNLE